MFRNSALKLLALILLSSLLISCTKKDNDIKDENSTDTNQPTSSKLEDRAIERWNALINKDWEKAYSYETPNFRKTYNIEEYKTNFGSAITWKSIKFLSKKQVNDKVTDVKVELTILFNDSGSKMLIPSIFDARWLYSDNNWWHVLKK